MKRILLMTFLFLIAHSQVAYSDNYMGSVSAFSDPVIPEKVYRVGDFIQVEIFESSSSTYVQSREGSRDTEVAAKLASWVRFKTKRDGSGHTKVLKPSALDEPEIEFEADSRFANTASDKSKSSLKDSITTQIMDIRPNGNLYVVGRKEVRENGEVRIVNISGEVAQLEVNKGQAVRTNKIYNLKVEIIEEGTRNDRTKLNLFQKFLLFIWPF